MTTRPTILLVEDEALLREMTKDDLEDLGFDVLCAQNAGEALQALGGSAPVRILITDIRMPGDCDGWDLARRARALRPDLHVMYISGYSELEPQPVSGSVFVKKPYRFSEVESALAQFGLS